MHTKLRSLNHIALLGFFAVGTIGLSTGLLLSGQASAAANGGRQCILTTCYSSASKTTKVGEFSSCPGGIKSGHMTSYCTSETFSTAPVGPGASKTGTGGLPCALRANSDTCVNLPANPRPD
jgi:hypothetical protein